LPNVVARILRKVRPTTGQDTNLRSPRCVMSSRRSINVRRWSTWKATIVGTFPMRAQPC